MKDIYKEGLHANVPSSWSAYAVPIGCVYFESNLNDLSIEIIL